MTVFNLLFKVSLSILLLLLYTLCLQPITVVLVSVSVYVRAGGTLPGRLGGNALVSIMATSN